MAQDTDYRTLLKEELADRCRRNPKYSLRAFARDLGVSAPRLSHVMNGDHGLSRAAAHQIATQIGWNSSEIDYFCDLVESAHGRSQVKRSVARARLADHANPYRSIENDTFRIISDWHHFAILELIQVEGFRNDPQWIGKTLGISNHEAAAALERLKRLGAIEDAEGSLCVKNDFSANPKEISSEAIRKFNRQILRKATNALSFQTVQERDFSTITLAIDESDLPRAKEVIRKFRRRFDAEFSKKAKRKTKVYCLGVQLFGLQEPS